MNLKLATDFLIIGLFYTVLYKIILFVFGSSLSSFMYIVYSILWIAALCTIIFFCYYFLKEVTPMNSYIQISLKVVIIFTILIIIIRLPFNFFSQIYFAEYLLFDISRLLIVLSLFIFLINFYRELSPNFIFLKTPIFILVIGFGINTLFGLIANYHYLLFLFTGKIAGPMEIFTPIANVAGIITLLVEFYFLLLFRRVEHYSDLLIRKHT